MSRLWALLFWVTTLLFAAAGQAQEPDQKVLARERFDERAVISSLQ